MTNSLTLASVLKLLILLSCVLFLFMGTRIVLVWGEVPQMDGSKYAKDSTYTRTEKIDSTGKANTAVTETKVIRSTPVALYSESYKSAADGMVKKGYDLLFLGIILLIVLLALPHLSEFSFLQLFSAKFRGKVEAGKMIINEAANTSNSAPVEKPVMSEKTVPSPQEGSTELSIENFSYTIPNYATDPQKNKWGGKAVSNDRRMSADVECVSTSKELFRVILKVNSTNVEKPLKGKVTFHLHPTFSSPDPTIYVLHGEAKLELVAWGAFTVGAETDDGATRLELDLAELPQAPMLFKSR